MGDGNARLIVVQAVASGDHYERHKNDPRDPRRGRSCVDGERCFSCKSHVRVVPRLVEWKFFSRECRATKALGLCAILGSPPNNAWQLRVIWSKV